MMVRLFLLSSGRVVDPRALTLPRGYDLGRDAGPVGASCVVDPWALDTVRARGRLNDHGPVGAPQSTGPWSPLDPRCMAPMRPYIVVEGLPARCFDTCKYASFLTVRYADRRHSGGDAEGEESPADIIIQSSPPPDIVMQASPRPDAVMQESPPSEFVGQGSPPPASGPSEWPQFGTPVMIGWVFVV